MPIKFRKKNQGRRAVPDTLGSPTGGLNGRDSLAEMPHSDAFQLDNWFPGSTSVDTRAGSLDFATGMTGPVESIEVHTGGAGSKMLAFSNGSIFNVTAGGAVGAALATGKASNKVFSIMFSNAGSQFLLIFSGADQPLSFDGTTLAGLTITALTGSQNTLQTAMAFKGRVYLSQINQLGFYYLAVGAIQGAASFFDLQQQASKGGSVVAMVSFSEDSGIGPRDYAVFVTSEGEYIMYNGTDPSNAAAWDLVGRFYGPPPIGKKGWFKYRSDVYFITEEGILSFAQIRQMGDDNADRQYLTSKLGRNYTDITTYQSVHGWMGMIYPRGGALLINVPLTGAESGPYAQFIMNTNTNAWCKYSGWNGISWALFNRRAYFGTNDGRVVLADEGVTDNGAQIMAIARQAWNTFDDQDNTGLGDADKQFHFASFAVQADGSPAISASINVNYEDDAPTNTTALADTGGATWDVSNWDTDNWAGTAATQTISVPIGKLGYIASVWMQAASQTAKIRWFGTRVILEKTRGVLLQ